MYEMKTGTLFFQDKNGNNVLALNNVNELDLTSNTTEERDILGNVENIKRGETTLSFTNITNKEDLFKVLGVDTSNVPDAYSILLTKPIQRRRHKKKRINKKWLKKYGYKLLVDYKDGWRIKSYKDGVYEFVKEKNYDRT